MPEEPKKTLSLFDSTSLIVGIIVGVGIYEMAPSIALGAGSWWGVMLIWVVGGALSLCGALGYAELATMYPREGGDYVYLTRAYGRWSGFLFGWVQLLIARPGDIVVPAFIFARYAREIYDPFTALVPYDKIPLEGFADEAVPYSQLAYAAGAVVVLTLINVMGVRGGKWTQNLLTVVKAVGLLTIVGIAVAVPQASPIVRPAPSFVPGLPLALIFVLFTFGGWNEMAYVAAEVKNPKRNIVRALVMGTVAVTVLYLIVNGAFLYSLGYEGLANSQAVATDAVSTAFPEIGSRLIAAMICISALGCVNGLIFTGARISYAVGKDHRAFRILGTWDSQTGTPVRALLLQATIAMVLIALLGSVVGAVLYTASAVYLFFLATSLAVIVLRYKEGHVQRPFRAWGYPVTTIIFCIVCGYLIYSAVTYKPEVALGALIILLLGLPVYWLTTPRSKGDGTVESGS